MLFNSFEFVIFLPVTFLLYWFVFSRHLTLRNAFVLVASYIFYGWWDPRFLILIALSTLLDYFVALRLGRAQAPRARRVLLAVSLMGNLGCLGYFKYFNFFVDSWIAAFTSIGYTPSIHTTHIVLPVGISFYTFQTLSYTIDVYRRKLEPTRDFVAFAAFVSFFPQLVAGPIERASNLLLRFEQPAYFNYDVARDAMRQILWGFFKKIVVADTCGRLANPIFADYESHTGWVLMLGAVYFAFQIYGDFSGYSDIAIGTARLFGFDLMRNFAYPYFSCNIAEFWRRWHISLSTWFRDYVYIPLGGSHGTRWTTIRNTFVVFITSGLWHGANWTFVVWGLLHWLYFIPAYFASRNRSRSPAVGSQRWLPRPTEILQMITTFALVTIAWIVFRSPSVGAAWGYTSRMLSSLHTPPHGDIAASGVLWISVLVTVEWLQRRKDHGLAIGNLPLVARWLAYLLIATLCVYKYQPNSEFIYFQF